MNKSWIQDLAKTNKLKKKNWLVPRSTIQGIISSLWKYKLENGTNMCVLKKHLSQQK